MCVWEFGEFEMREKAKLARRKSETEKDFRVRCCFSVPPGSFARARIPLVLPKETKTHLFLSVPGEKEKSRGYESRANRDGERRQDVGVVVVVVERKMSSSFDARLLSLTSFLRFREAKGGEKALSLSTSRCAALLSASSLLSLSRA